MRVEQRLRELNIALPEMQRPVATYVTAVRTGNLLFVSGVGPAAASPKGKLGAEVSVDQGYQAARECGLQLLARVKEALGELDNISRVVKLLGMVNCTPDFDQQPQVINGCSDLFVDVLGDAGRHARSAVGMSGLPGGICVEIEAIFEVSDERAS
ncbi:MAG: RidA family protein [Chloroflexota bacterium]|nr:RidA family protein [Chloroflexota bacterium]